MEKGSINKWFRNFLKIHPELSERVPETQDRCRNRMSNCHVMDQYFKLLNNKINTLEFTDHPDRIFNGDETGWNGKGKSKIKFWLLKENMHTNSLFYHHQVILQH